MQTTLKRTLGLSAVVLSGILLAGCGASVAATSHHATTVSPAAAHGHGHGKSGKGKGKHPTKGSGHSVPAVIKTVSTSGIVVAQGTHDITVKSQQSLYVGPYKVSETPWTTAGETVKLSRQGKSITGLAIVPLAEGKVSAISGQTVTVTSGSHTWTLSTGMTLPRLGLSGVTIGTGVMLVGSSVQHVVGFAGIPTVISLVVVAANSANGTVTVQTAGGKTITVPYQGPLHRLLHLGLGHHVKVSQAPDGQWLSAR